MSDSSVINWQKGVSLNDGAERFKLQIDRFEELKFDPTIEQMFNNIMKMDYKSLRANAQFLKSESSSLAAERLEKIAIELEQSAIKEDEQRIIENFDALMEEAQALKRYIANINKKKLDLTKFQNYVKEVNKKYKPPHTIYLESTTLQENKAQCCSRCNLF